MEILWWTYLATLYGTILWIAIQFVRIANAQLSQLFFVYNFGIPFVVHWGPDATKYFLEKLLFGRGGGSQSFLRFNTFS